MFILKYYLYNEYMILIKYYHYENAIWDDDQAGI